MTPPRGAKAPARRVRERSFPYSGASSPPVVVDASIAVLWFAHEPDRWGAERLLESNAPLLAPDLMAVEATNAWSKKLRRKEMGPADVEQAVTFLLALGFDWTSSTSLLRPATRLAVELGHPVYDCLYIALAKAHAAPLATADERLRRVAERTGVRSWDAESSGPLPRS
jgi:predicted nucleic acid-binding protein